MQQEEKRTPFQRKYYGTLHALSLADAELLRLVRLPLH